MDKETVAARLKMLRGNKTQQALADEIGLKQSTYAMYESGERVPGDENKIKIAKHYKKTVQEIFFD